MARGGKKKSKRSGGKKAKKAPLEKASESDDDVEAFDKGQVVAMVWEGEEEGDDDDDVDDDDDEEEETTEARLRREARERAQAEKQRKRRARAEKAARREAMRALGGPEKVRLRHILIKHTGARNRFSKRAMHEVTTTEAEARAELKAMLAELLAELSVVEAEGVDNVGSTVAGGQEDMHAKFCEFATQRSDCSTHKDGGDMGWFSRGNMHPRFDNVAFGLALGQLSNEIVETDSGLHLLLRIG